MRSRPVGVDSIQKEFNFTVLRSAVGTGRWQKSFEVLVVNVVYMVGGAHLAN